MGFFHHQRDHHHLQWWNIRNRKVSLFDCYDFSSVHYDHHRLEQAFYPFSIWNKLVPKHFFNQTFRLLFCCFGVRTEKKFSKQTNIINGLGHLNHQIECCLRNQLYFDHVIAVLCRIHLFSTKRKHWLKSINILVVNEINRKTFLFHDQDGDVWWMNEDGQN